MTRDVPRDAHPGVSARVRHQGRGELEATSASDDRGLAQTLDPHKECYSEKELR